MVDPLLWLDLPASASGLPRNPFYAGAGAKLDLALCLGPWWTADNDDAEVDSAALFVRLAFENLLSQCGGLCAYLSSFGSVLIPAEGGQALVQ